jgi:CO dehydrogenase maturation factor
MLTTHLLLRRQEVLIMDMEAGVENLGRATAGAVDAMLIVVEPGRRSVDTAQAIQRLAQDIHIPRIYAVGCKVRSESDQRFLVESLPNLEVIGSLPWSDLALEADRRGVSVYDLDPQMVAAARAIKERLEKLLEI